MGKNDNLIEDYRNIITNMLLDNQIIVSILSNETLTPENSDILVGGEKPKICPYEFVPNILTETGSYIMYDMDESAIIPRGSNKNTCTQVELYFWIATHRNMTVYKNRLRNDVLSRELKKLFGEADGLGIAKNHFIYNKIFDTYNNNYTGRVLKFLITDWSDKIRYKNERQNKLIGA